MLSGAVHGAKVNQGCDVDTLQIRARDHHVVGDSPVAAELLAQKPSHATVASSTGDGAYETQYVHEACHRRRAITIIPSSRLHSREKGSIRVSHRNEAVKACYLETLERLPLRSLVETGINCF